MARTSIDFVLNSYDVREVSSYTNYILHVEHDRYASIEHADNEGMIAVRKLQFLWSIAKHFAEWGNQEFKQYAVLMILLTEIDDKLFKQWLQYMSVSKEEEHIEFLATIRSSMAVRELRGHFANVVPNATALARIEEIVNSAPES